MANAYFFGMTLKGANSSELWNPKVDGADKDQGDHILVIKEVLVGPEAREGEVNVLQAETDGWKDTVRIPIAWLKAGGPNNQVYLDLTFHDSVWFTLVEGKGPVHIIGLHEITSSKNNKEGEEESECETSDDEEEDETDGETNT